MANGFANQYDLLTLMIEWLTASAVFYILKNSTWRCPYCSFLCFWIWFNRWKENGVHVDLMTYILYCISYTYITGGSQGGKISRSTIPTGHVATSTIWHLKLTECMIFSCVTKLHVESSPQLKTKAHKALVGPLFGVCMMLWCPPPHTHTHSHTQKGIPGRFARYVLNGHRNISSPTEML